MPLSKRFEAEALLRMRRDLMKRGFVVSTLLADVLGGKKPPGLDAILHAKPGLRPEEALRMTLDQLEQRRKLLDANDDRYGRCDSCGIDLGVYALGEMPWADACRTHG